MTDFLPALASYGLHQAPRLALDAEWDATLRDVDEHRLIGLLAAAVDAGDLAVDEPQRVEVAAQHEAYMVAAMALERTLIEVDTVLESADVPSRVLKGPALAHTLARRPNERVFGDIDLLISSHDLDRAVAALVDAGAQRPLPQLAPGYDRRFAKSVTLTWVDHEIDLHRTLAAGPFGEWIAGDGLWAEPVGFEVAGRSFATLDRERHLVHGCYHAVLGDIEPRLASLRDIAMLAEHPEIDHRQARALASAWQGSAVLAAGLVATAQRLPGRTGELYDWAQSYRVGDRAQRALTAYRTEHRRFARQSLAMIRALPRWRDRAAFVRAVAWPSADHLEARGLTRRRHLFRR